MDQGSDSSDVDESTERIETGPVLHEASSSDGPSTAVVEHVAAVTDRDPIDLPLLQDSIDADALNALLDGGISTSRSAVRVEFDYAGVTVVVDSTDGVSVRERASDGEAAE